MRNVLCFGKKNLRSLSFFVAALFRGKGGPPLLEQPAGIIIKVPGEEGGRSEAESPVDIVHTGSWEGII